MKVKSGWKPLVAVTPSIVMPRPPSPSTVTEEECISMRERTLGALLAGSAGIALLLGSAAVAAEQKVGLQQQTAVAVTIYNENLALVRDQRTVALDHGENHLAFVDVSAMIR